MSTPLPAPASTTDGHVTLEQSPTQLRGTCGVCDEQCDVPNKGLGRATLAAWRTRHQHPEHPGAVTSS